MLVGRDTLADALSAPIRRSRQTVGGRPYMKLSGTSMAAAVVSGTVALMIEQARVNFGAAPPVNAIKAMLQVSALPMTDASGAAVRRADAGRRRAQRRGRAAAGPGDQSRRSRRQPGG